MARDRGTWRGTNTRAFHPRRGGGVDSGERATCAAGTCNASSGARACSTGASAFRLLILRAAHGSLAAVCLVAAGCRLVAGIDDVGTESETASGNGGSAGSADASLEAGAGGAAGRDADAGTENAGGDLGSGGSDAADADADVSIDSPRDGDAPVDVEVGHALGCPQGARPPKLLLVHPGDAGKEYCVDETEVTHSQYRAFVHAVNAAPTTYEQYLPRPPADSQAVARCNYRFHQAGGLDAAPENRFWLPACEGYPPYDLDDPSSDEHPVVCVEWCNAYAYCAWAGKRLCAAQGGQGVEIAVDASVPPPTGDDEWTVACRGENPGDLYPYGGTSYQQNLCYDGNNFVKKTEDSCYVKPWVCTRTAADLPSCKSPSGAIAMSGNVWEWEHACAPGCDELDPPRLPGCCRTRGGGYTAVDGAQMQCLSMWDKGFPSYARNPDLGFRCCADAVSDAGDP
jgi:formylglycine-generating enzyme required for sulfatase activity